MNHNKTEVRLCNISKIDALEIARMCGLEYLRGDVDSHFLKLIGTGSQRYAQERRAKDMAVGVQIARRHQTSNAITKLATTGSYG